VPLDDITLTVRAGELVALMGPAVPGKSTLLHVSAGLDQADTGTIAARHAPPRLDNAGSHNCAKRSVGFVEQHSTCWQP
jgi:putative ABC transport system ATP-binding protein